MLRSRLTLVMALMSALVMSCGTNHASGSPASNTGASHTAPVQHVSDKTICDLLFRDSGVMVQSVAMMGSQQTSPATARQAHQLAREAQTIGSHASGAMVSKVAALTNSLRDFAAWVESPTGSFTGEDFSVAGLELGNSCGLSMPMAQSTTTPALPADSGSATDETKRLSYFDVTVGDHLHASGHWAADVKVCYVRPHPGANQDGTTRVSTDPWSVLIQRTDGSLVPVPVGQLSPTSAAPVPRYVERLLRLGECQTGWITVKAPQGGSFAGMRYAPKDFPTDSAMWRW